MSEPEPLAVLCLRLYVAVRAAVAELNSEGWIHGASPAAATLRDAIGCPDPMALPPPGPTDDRSSSDG